MSRVRVWIAVLASMAVLGTSGAVFAQPKPALKIGVTLHPYYSWTRNIVGDLPGYEVRSILPGEIDAGDYQPRPDDIKKLVDLDAIVVNGIGHDDFIMPMLKASGNKKIVIIRPNETTPQIHAGARQQRELAHVHLVHQRDPADLCDPEGASPRCVRRTPPPCSGTPATTPGGCGSSSRRRPQQLAEAKITRVVTVHDGYGYLLQEFGLEVAGRRPAGARADAVGGGTARHGQAAPARENSRRLQRGDVSRTDAEGPARTKAA